MAQNVEHALLQEARRADLYDFCIRNHADMFIREGSSIRFVLNHSVSIKRGYAGYKDFSSDETGNSVDFLTKYLDYDLVSAVIALTGGISQQSSVPAQKQPVLKQDKASFQLPPAIQGRYNQLFAYLTQTRKIPGHVVQKMIDHHILYQEQEHNNAIFVNAEHTMYEASGTLSGSRFKQAQYKSDQSAFWWFKSGQLKGQPRKIYICESAIDAMSLFSIHAYQHAINPTSSTFMDVQSLYVSLSGVGNVQKVDRILQHKAENVFVELAVDNDEAGRALCDKYTGMFISSLLPSDPYKDWNDVLRAEIDQYEQQKQLNLTLPAYL